MTNNSTRSGDFESVVDMITTTTTISGTINDIYEIKKKNNTLLLNNCANKSDLITLNNNNHDNINNKVQQRPQFSISSPDRKRGLSSIIDTLRTQKLPKKGKFMSYLS